MPTLDDLVGELRRMGVLAGEIPLTRREFGRHIERATEVVENDDDEDGAD